MKQFYFLMTLTLALGLSLHQSVVAQNALYFDGVNDFASVSNASALITNQNMSISFWVNPMNTAPSYPNFDGMAGFRNNTNADFYILQLGVSTIEARFRNSAGTNYDISFNGLVLNDWNHFVLTYNGSALTLYHNGVAVGTQAATGFITSATETFYLGNLLFNTTNFYLQGQLDDVCLWSKNLTSIEVTTLYNACSVNLNDANLKLCYELNQGTAGGNNTTVNFLIDSKGNLNGVFSGFAMTGNISNFIAYSNNAYNTLNVSICNGGTYTSPNGTVLTTSGTYQQTIVGGSVNGCDSVITIHLGIGNTSNSTVINPVVCNSYTTASGKVYNTSGTYSDTLTGFSGCDSIVTINLTVKQSSSAVMNVVACGSFTAPSGNDAWTLSGTYTDVISNAAGCDSLITIFLTIKNNTTADIMVQTCGSYTSPSGNHTWTTSGNYTDIFPNAAGCDSILSINLIIKPLPDTSITVNAHTLTANQVGATYQWLDCDNGNTPIPNETGASFTATTNGNYAVAITFNDCSATSNCYLLDPVGTHEVFSTSVKAFPNPTTGILQIDLGKSYSEITIRVTDIIGQVVQKTFFNNNQLLQLDLGTTSGFYFVEIIANGQRTVLKVFVE